MAAEAGQKVPGFVLLAGDRGNRVSLEEHAMEEVFEDLDRDL